MPVTIVSAGARAFISYGAYPGGGGIAIVDLRTGVPLGQIPEEFASVVAVSSDGNRLASFPITPIFDYIDIWHRRRPEWWWGVAYLPEFWFTIIFGFGLVWSVWRDRRGLGLKPADTPAQSR
jgi:hypothetical protein